MSKRQIRENDRYEGDSWSAQVLAIAKTRSGEVFIVFQEGVETKSLTERQFKALLRQHRAKKSVTPKFSVGDTFLTDEGYRVEILAVSPTISHRYGCHRYFCQIEWGEEAGQYDYSSLSDDVLRNYQRILV